jgi:hypothetical protein
MFYSTRYFFRLVGLLLAAYLIFTRFPDIRWGLRHVWEYIERFITQYTLHEVVSLVYDAIYSVINKIE